MQPLLGVCSLQGHLLCAGFCADQYKTYPQHKPLPFLLRTKYSWFELDGSD